ncbi:MAG TPA: Uma2 family endonuclease [Methylomirabilota bacterium]|jgi:Uma2 family endonuclease|nr:Uma2 family endonuclease [Methylomirabilota bacterium]
MPQTVGWAELDFPLKLNIQAAHLSDEQFLRLCQENPDLRIEMNARGELVIMPPTGMKAGIWNNRLSFHLEGWTRQSEAGFAFDSSTMFTLPNGAKRSPDASWIRRERWEALSEAQQEGIGPLCPDFVVELCSPSDRLPVLQEKMQEYIDNGARLGWLIDPLERRVYIYRPGQPIEQLADPATLSGDPVLPGFVLPVGELW